MFLNILRRFQTRSNAVRYVCTCLHAFRFIRIRSDAFANICTCFNQEFYGPDFVFLESSFAWILSEVWSGWTPCTLPNCVTARPIIKVCGLAYSIQDFRENPRFSRKSEIFTKIRDVHENPRFSRKSKIFAKIQNFPENLENLRFLQKSETFAKNPRFSQKSEIFANIRDFFCENSRSSNQPKRTNERTSERTNERIWMRKVFGIAVNYLTQNSALRFCLLTLYTEYSTLVMGLERRKDRVAL